MSSSQLETTLLISVQLGSKSTKEFFDQSLEDSDTNQIFLFLRWRSGDKNNKKKFDPELPAEKQFLITERVPCQKRIADVESAADAIQEIELNDGWYEARPPDAGEEGQV